MVLQIGMITAAAFPSPWADRTKHIGRGEAEIFGGRGGGGGAAGLAPYPGQRVFLADPCLVGEPQLDSRSACLRRPDSL